MLLLATGDEVQDVFGIHAGLKDRPLAYELAANFVFVDQISVMNDRDLPQSVVARNGLRVFQAVCARGAVAVVADRDVAL